MDRLTIFSGKYGCTVKEKLYKYGCAAVKHGVVPDIKLNLIPVSYAKYLFGSIHTNGSYCKAEPLAYLQHSASLNCTCVTDIRVLQT